MVCIDHKAEIIILRKLFMYRLQQVQGLMRPTTIPN